MTQESYYKPKEPWPAVPGVLEVCENARQIGTTYERLCKHMVLHHNLPEWVVTHRAQVELEGMHDSQHAQECSHRHAKPIRIVGYEIKDEPPPPVLHKFPFATRDLAQAFVNGLGIFGEIEDFLVRDGNFIIHDEKTNCWVVTIRGMVPGFETDQPDANNEIWHKEFP